MILFDESFKAWKKLSPPNHDRNFTRLYAGNRDAAIRVFNAFVNSTVEECSQNITKQLGDIKGNFSAIIECNSMVILFVDSVRSYPVFYKIENGKYAVSNSIYELIDDLPNDYDSISEIRMTRYVTGRNTLYKNIKQLQAGECLIYSKADNLFKIIRYSKYFSEDVYDDSEATLIEKLDHVVDNAFQNVIEEIDGREVWIPLSGGLDSRLVLTKIRSLGYDRIRTFSYGPIGNHDAKWAKYVANELDVAWKFIPYTRNAAKEFFWSDKRVKYWRMASNGCSVPFMADELAIHTLINEYDGDYASDVVIVNGQSGDFISGGHVHGAHLEKLNPRTVYNSKVILDAIIAKHYTSNGKLNAANQDWLKNRIIASIGADVTKCDGEMIAKYYEMWEMSERQSKYVINGQRSYDYYGIDWFLPLWDKQMINFWMKVPYRYKVNQGLYRKFLDTMDWYGLFAEFKPHVWNWQRFSMLNIPIAKFVELTFGKDWKTKYYDFSSYFGRYSHNYAPFGFVDHVKHLDTYGRNPWGKYADQLLLELGCEIDR